MNQVVIPFLYSYSSLCAKYFPHPWKKWIHLERAQLRATGPEIQLRLATVQSATMGQACTAPVSTLCNVPLRLLPSRDGVYLPSLGNLGWPCILLGASEVVEVICVILSSGCKRFAHTSYQTQPLLWEQAGAALLRNASPCGRESSCSIQDYPSPANP
jgi:hypothetical protein